MRWFCDPTEERALSSAIELLTVRLGLNRATRSSSRGPVGYPLVCRVPLHAPKVLPHAEEHFAGRYTRLDIRFCGQFCYIDAYTEPLGPDWPPPDWPESHGEMIERRRHTPTHLWRLRYVGDEERWGFAFYTCSYSG